MLLATINSGTLIIALPDLERELHTTLLQLVWVILVYMIASTVLLLSAGRLSDLFGRKHAYVVGFAVFSLASLGAGFSGMYLLHRLRAEGFSVRLVEAGDGTAVMIQIIHAYGSKEKGFEYFKKLQSNNVGPSSSTGKLTALVNKGELFVANGDMQMNVNQIKTNPNVRIFWPAGPDGKRSTFALPYYIGLVKGAPHADAGKKLIDFLLSKDAQSTMTSLANGLPVRKDVTPTDENFTQFHKLMEGVTVWTPDWTKVLAELKDDAAKWREVTGN